MLMWGGMCEIVMRGSRGFRLWASSPSSDLSSPAILVTSSVLLNLMMILSFLLVVAVCCMVAEWLLFEMCSVIRLITSGAVVLGEVSSDLGVWTTMVECVVCCCVFRTMSE